MGTKSGATVAESIRNSKSFGWTALPGELNEIKRHRAVQAEGRQMVHYKSQDKTGKGKLVGKPPQCKSRVLGFVEIMGEASPDEKLHRSVRDWTFSGG